MMQKREVNCLSVPLSVHLDYTKFIATKSFHLYVQQGIII
jgi:hypothetical protein